MATSADAQKVAKVKTPKAEAQKVAKVKTPKANDQKVAKVKTPKAPAKVKTPKALAKVKTPKALAKVKTPKALAKVKTPKAVKSKAPASRPSFEDMISAAIVALNERKGSSRQAILKYITVNYKVSGADSKAVNSRIKAALKAGVGIGALIQTTGTGARGSFKLVQEKVIKKKLPHMTVAEKKKFDAAVNAQMHELFKKLSEMQDKRLQDLEDIQNQKLDQIEKTQQEWMDKHNKKLIRMDQYLNQLELRQVLRYNQLEALVYQLLGNGGQNIVQIVNPVGHRRVNRSSRQRRIRRLNA